MYFFLHLCSIGKFCLFCFSDCIKCYVYQNNVFLALFLLKFIFGFFHSHWTPTIFFARKPWRACLCCIASPRTKNTATGAGRFSKLLKNTPKSLTADTRLSLTSATLPTPGSKTKWRASFYQKRWSTSICCSATIQGWYPWTSMCSTRRDTRCPSIKRSGGDQGCWLWTVML